MNFVKEYRRQAVIADSETMEGCASQGCGCVLFIFIILVIIALL